MWTPLDLAYGILMSVKPVLALTPDCTRWCAELQHAAIPYLHHFIEASAREDERTVFVPV
jgi:hypothetical protein